MTLMLGPERYEEAVAYILNNARPLDQALFEYHFQDGDARRVIDELADFQNTDGGFGRSLEPDLRSPSSSALATGMALKMLREVGATSDQPMVKNAVEYLLETLDRDTMLWRIIPEDANDHPHAPWWHDDDGSLAKTFDGFLVIPRVQILGHLHNYSDLVPGDLLADLTERTVADVETIGTFGSGGGDDIVYSLSFVGTEDAPIEYRDRVLARIRKVIPEAVCTDRSKWNTYCMRPLKVCSSPNSPIHDLIAEGVQEHLDYTIEQQSEDGAWDPVWTWGEMYPEDWVMAKKEWRGFLTILTLKMLRDFDRIEK